MVYQISNAKKTLEKRTCRDAKVLQRQIWLLTSKRDQFRTSCEILNIQGEVSKKVFAGKKGKRSNDPMIKKPTKISKPSTSRLPWEAR